MRPGGAFAGAFHVVIVVMTASLLQGLSHRLLRDAVGQFSFQLWSRSGFAWALFPSARTLTGRAPEMEEETRGGGSQVRLHDEGEGHFHPLGWDGASGSFALDNTRLHDSSIAYRILM